MWRRPVRRWYNPPHWQGNPRWWHHVDRVVGWLLVLAMVAADLLELMQ